MEIFWAYSPKYEKTLQQPTNPRLQEDHQFLEKPRKASKEARLLNQSIEVDVDKRNGLSLLSSTDADADDDGDEFTKLSSLKKMTTKKESMTAKLGVLANKQQISDCALTEIMGASTVDQGVDIDECAVSVMSTNWKRKESRSLLAQDTEVNQQKIISDANYFVMQWDGKVLQGFEFLFFSDL